MAQITIATFAKPQLVYRADPKCPRTVVFQFVNTVFPPGVIALTGASVWLCADYERLEKAFDVITQGIQPLGVGLSDGVTVGPNASQNNIVLEEVKSDIYAVAAQWNQQGTARALGGFETFTLQEF